MTQEDKQHEDDDGRVICDMDVEGMPWHGKRSRERAAAQRQAHGDQLNASETRQAIWGAVLAALSVVGVLSLTMVLFVLFCIYVWFR